MSCVLRVFGNEFNVDDYLKESSFLPCKIFRKGEPRSSKPNAKLLTDSGFNLDVSHADFEFSEQQLSDAIEFLKSNSRELNRLKDFPGIEEICLDFAISVSDVWFSKSIRLNVQLIEEAAKYRIEIEISLYKSE